MTKMHATTHVIGPAGPLGKSDRHVIVGGIDTHKDLHVAAVINASETVLGTASFSTTRAGYRALIRWMRTFGDVSKVGIEGTGSY
jgi:transposase